MKPSHLTCNSLCKKVFKLQMLLFIDRAFQFSTFICVVLIRVFLRMHLFHLSFLIY